ncbi:MAG: TraR/DksA family transcriptional regulator [Xanthomonadaceae bacterium]|nr:TraR/DksA family transcriptional regulator [Xanthomonadaceae bacterium]
MRKTDLIKFKKLFESQRSNLLYNDRVIREDFIVQEEEKFDEVDQATTDTEQSMKMRLRNREILHLKKIDLALQRVEEGIFGLCENCEEAIEMKRLQARPTATLCLGCKEDEERKEMLTAVGRAPKSLGNSLRV